jgi:hypothetical protein
MTWRTTTRLFSRHPVPGREGAKQGRRFYVPKQRLYILCIFCIFVIFCISDIFCIFCRLHILHILRILHILHISDLFMLCRYILRSSQPVYGFWYYIMIHRAIGIHLQKILPKLVPKTDAEVDALLDCKLRVYVVHILHILHI